MEADIDTAISQMRREQAYPLGDMNFDQLVALLVGMAKDSRGQEAAHVGNEVIQRHESTAEMALLSVVLP